LTPGGRRISCYLKGASNVGFVVRLALRWGSARTLGGIAGIGGAALVLVGALASLRAPGLLGIVLLMLCELELVSLLFQSSRGSAGCAVLVLGAGLIIGATGVIGGGLLGPAYASIGIVCWVVVAAVAAIAVARVHLMAVQPAVALATVTTVLLILNPAVLRPDNPVVQATAGVYLLAWAWVGSALLGPRLRVRRCGPPATVTG
jgi:hypothetical protein